MNDGPCSYSVVLTETLGSVCALKILHVLYSRATLTCSTCCPQHLSTSLCNTLQFLTVSVTAAVAAVGASEMLCLLLVFE